MIMGRVTPLSLFLLSLVSFFGTYNLITMIIRHRTIGSGKWKAGGLESPNTQLFPDPIIQMPENLRKPKSENLLFHIVVTATEDPYSKWQCRIMYYWYMKKKDLPALEMGKLTQILHAGSPDNLMDETPTFVVDPLPEGLCCPQ